MNEKFVSLEPTANEAWTSIIHIIHEYGTEQIVRELKTLEVINATQQFDMNYPICYHQKRRLNYSFMAADALFITSGDNRVANLAPYNKNIAQFSDDGQIFNGSYGPPFNEQLMHVVKSLLDDTYSRQAVLTIWKSNPIFSKDIPCTLSMQFLLRDDKLNTVVNMRSSDCWLGIPYDFFNFTIMTLRVLTFLNDFIANNSENKEQSPKYSLGIMFWNAGSSHMYDHDSDKAYKVLSEYPDIEDTQRIPICAYYDWKFIVDSLIACRDKNEEAIIKNNLWRIRPQK